MEIAKTKEQLLQYCKDFIETKALFLQQNLKSIEESLLSETKSSAGDKHETGRAMLHIEREKIAQQISNLNNLSEVISKIKIKDITKKISLGSLVLTSQNNYFISVGIGKILIEEITYFAISPSSPIGSILMGKNLGEEVKFRDNHFKIKEIK